MRYNSGVILNHPLTGEVELNMTLAGRVKQLKTRKVCYRAVV